LDYVPERIEKIVKNGIVEKDWLWECFFIY
jgi:hypothetical protein